MKLKDNMIVVSCDHGYEYQPGSGELNLSPEKIISLSKKASADSIILNKGSIVSFSDLLNSSGMKTILNFNSRNTVSKRFSDLATLDDIINLKVDGVFFQLLISPEENNIDSYNRLFSFCHSQGIPITGTVIVKDKVYESSTSIEDVRYGARIASELGLSSFMIGDVFSMDELNSIMLESFVPLWIGIKKSDDPEDLFHRIHEFREIGVKGIILGRSFWSKLESPKIMEAIHKVYSLGRDPQRVFHELKSPGD